MQASDEQIQEFLKTICRQIRYKGVHRNIRDELLDHMEEQKNEYIRQGQEAETAARMAVEQMGDPVLVGRQLDLAHRPRTEWSILVLAALLIAAGGVVQFLLSGVNGHHSDMFSRFVVYAPIGAAALVGMYFFDYTLLGRHARLAYLILFAAAVAGFLAWRVLNGFTVWLKVNGAFTHVYYIILLYIPVFGGIVHSFRNRGYMGVLSCSLLYLGPVLLCLAAPRLSALLLFTLCYLILMTTAITKGYFGANKRVCLAIVYTPAALAVLLLVCKILFISPYLIPRMQTMLHPELDPMGSGYQHLLIRQLAAASKLFGEAAPINGFAGMSLDRYLPGWSTDLALAYIIARFGYAAGMAIVAVILLLIVRMFVSVLRQKNACGFLVAFSACLSITGQVVLYVLTNIGIITPFSWSLPFIACGGTGFVVNLALVGLVLSVYRRSHLVVDTLHNNPVNRPFFSYSDGKLIIDLGMQQKNPDKGGQ